MRDESERNVLSYLLQETIYSFGGNSFKEELRVEQRKALRERFRRFIHRL